MTCSRRSFLKAVFVSFALTMPAIRMAVEDDEEPNTVQFTISGVTKGDRVYVARANGGELLGEVVAVDNKTTATIRLPVTDTEVVVARRTGYQIKPFKVGGLS